MLAIVGGSAVRHSALATGGGGATILFQDSFATGDYSHTQNGISWSGTVYCDITQNTSRTGTYCNRFREGDSLATNSPDGWAELRFTGLPSPTELFIEYYLYLPTGAESPTLGPKAKIIGPINDKFFRLWGPATAYSVTNFGNEIGASTWGDGSGTDGNVGVEYMYSAAGEGNQWGMGMGPGPDTRVSFFKDANRGRWVQIRMRCKQASVANNDGVFQLWVDGVLQGCSSTTLVNGDIYSLGPSPVGYVEGYILGFANNGWPVGQYVYLDDVTLSTGGFI